MVDYRLIKLIKFHMKIWEIKGNAILLSIKIFMSKTHDNKFQTIALTVAFKYLSCFIQATLRRHILEKHTHTTL